MTAKFIVDVVVPVYNAPDDVRSCVESVLAHTEPGYRLVLIDDASPDPGVARVFDEIARAAHPHVELLRNERNLGFTGTANRGMGLSRRDVVLLNSDTIVTDGWLGALLRCAASDPSIGTITPWSNNAEILSYPRFCVNNAWPEGADPAPLARAFARAAVPSYPDLPTGVGFCFFVRRAMLDAIGGFDTAFGAGYGEENDLCMRAAAAGWRNVLADDALVLHTGGRSFEKQKDALVPKNTATLLARHPGYLSLVHDYVAADPLAPLRDAATLALDAADPVGVLHILHHQGGGTETHVRALVAATRGRCRHAIAVAVGDRWRIEAHRPDGGTVVFDLERLPDEPWGDFLGGLCATLGIGLVHVHNVSACRDGLLTALAAIDLPFGYTVHDVNAGCPTITFLGPDGMYCGAQTDPATCGACLAAQPAFAGVDIVAWRDAHRPLVERASFLIAPSRWAADTLARFYPSARVRVVPHGIPEATPRHAGTRLAVMLPDDGVPTVAVLGAVGPDKGARRIERLVELARERGSSVRFVLIGYLDRQHSAWQSDDARFTVHGRYDPRDLPDLLSHYRVSLVLYPSAGPETFSYTLSEAWSAGRPVLVPPIGALPERVSPTGAGWVLDDAEWRDERRMLDRIETLLASSRAVDLARASRAAAAMPRITLESMATATLACYESALRDRRTSAHRPLARERVRDALGYRPWSPPSAQLSRASARADAGSRIAQTALRLRLSSAGPLLRAITPGFLREALKARLR
ncbi:MAG: glycosyltransferase [Betaproteobacteria bacterium]|nr:glycosyltransferase [Betaproteobacteria bacterium]